MNYCSVSVDGDLLEAVEDRTDDLDHRDDWVQDAINQYLTHADLHDRPDLDPDEFRQLVVERAIERKLVSA
jgi:metal-responsive CopG/Arc/MetJ family transcriptional regulator